MKVINWKHRTEFYWADCTHKLNSDEHTDCPYCRIAELETALIEAERDWEQERRNFRKLEATIKRVEDNIRSWDEHSTTGLESFVVNSFRAALGEAK